ncbi:hypothetical protein M422DRAFT_235800 [Sphaerobolus stellatus SS14]|uniref:BTB domain-containing protein n=1 Tax=Sphaerobolus stellatus (strain SS14) TaxID=990650 RepID=A0A0C9UG80_SPHS4|nr:hypothetical protein M422DRAFT_235800 [Sphaerobolus stellatus SS14]
MTPKTYSTSSAMTLKSEPDAESHPSDPSKWKRHPELYLSDGSVVLLAGNTLFRVYLQWLARKSEVFANLSSFEKVQPNDADTYDGCPLVRVSDAPKDVEYFLTGLDACSDYFFPDSPTPWAPTAAILQLSTKYMVSRLRERAIHHLCRLYPTSFDDMNPHHKDLADEVFGLDGGPEHPIILVNLARSCNVSKLLPWAYYSVVRWSFKDMVLGHKCHDGTLVQLSDQDRTICLLGFDTLMGIQHKNMKEIFSGPCARCTDKGEKCSSAIEDAFRRALEEHGTGLIAPLGPLRRKVLACERCKENISRLDEEKRKEVWQNLPKAFGLPPWGELLEDTE